MKNYKLKLFIICLLGILTILSFIACKDPQTKIDRDKLVEANALDVIMENHTSIKETVKYYENLKKDETYETISYYSSDNNGVYVAAGYDTASDNAVPDKKTENDSHFNTYISNDTEYHYLTDTGKMTVYPLTSDYMNDFLKDSFVIDSTANESVTSVEYRDGKVKITTEADITELFTKDTLSKMEDLAGKKLNSVQYIYTANESSLLLSSLETSYIAEDGTAFLFSKASISYDVKDDAKPSTEFVNQYLSTVNTRNISVIEKSETSTVVKNYTVPASMSPDFKCFESFYGYTIYTDENCTYKYSSETPDENGNYPNATFYAQKDIKKDISRSKKSGTSQSES